jgi:hypothetical protein
MHPGTTVVAAGDPQSAEVEGHLVDAVIGLVGA